MDAVIFLPWPDKRLSPNARVHWSSLARAKKAAKEAAYYVVRQAGISTIDADRVAVRFTFYPPDNRRRDLDNAIACTKAMSDGIALAIGIDDAKWDVTYSWAGEIKMHGMVKVELRWEAKEKAA